MKYLEISDYHFSMKWLDHSIECAKKVREQAKDVDFIAIVGDFFDAPIFATRKGGVEEAKKIVSSWLEVCPVVAIEGTPSHDAPGCYSIFEDMPGFTLLKPNKVYGLIQDRIVVAKEGYKLDGIIFGVPELSKNTIQAQLGLPAEQANAMATTLFKQYVEDFIAPMRMKHANIPAVGLFHGNFSDSQRDNETDIILKASDIVIHTEDLVIANLDRCSFGHIHTPWESKIINGGYPGFPGMDSNPWGKTGFTPAFNMIDNGTVTRIPYGTPKRLKVKHSSEITNNVDAWWVETKDHLDELPSNLHPWSRITYKENESDTRRVTEEEAGAITSLWDLFKLIDPTVHPDLKSKVDLITETIKHDLPGRKNVRLESLEVAGCILFKGRLVKLDNLQEGLTQIAGQNGDGKSSLLSMCHAYPLIIGKNKGDVLKNFFNGKESYVKKTIYLNDVKHEHLITIKAAHTKSAKTECYLTIDGLPQLDKGSLKEMMAKCEELYGNLQDYRITSFCEQPQQANNNMSGLMSAKPIDARDIVQTIAGVDREQEKRFALDKVKELETANSKLEIKLEVLEGSVKEGLEDLLLEANRTKELTESQLSEILCKGNLYSEKVKLLTAHQTNYSMKLALESEISYNNKQIKELQELTSTLKANKVIIATDNEALQRQQALKDYNTYLSLKKAYDDGVKQLAEYVADLKDARILADTLDSERVKLDSIIFNKLQSDNQNKLDNLKAKLESISNPCEHCGKLSSSLQQQVDAINEQIKAIVIEPLRQVDNESVIHTRIAKADQAKLSIPVLESRIAKELIEPTVVIKPAVTGQPLSSFERLSIEEDIKAAESATVKINMLIADNESKHPELITANDDRSTELLAAEKQVQITRTLYTDCKVEIERLSGLVTQYEQAIKDNNDKLKEIASIKAKLSNSDIDDWKYIASMLGSNKIPALELDMFLGVIDSEATRNIEPFLEGQFGFRTTTQENGIDKFDIFVIDRSTGQELSLFEYNPGHKAFFSDAYIKSLIRQRNSRMQRSYSPIIFDESDSPIKEDRIPMYYEINRKYFEKDNSRVLVVSQKDSAINYMSKVINMEELKC